MKTCIDCKEKKDYSQFSKAKRYKDGHLHRCKKCHNNKAKMRYEEKRPIGKRKNNKIILTSGEVLGDNDIVFIRDVKRINISRRGLFLCPKCGNEFESSIYHVNYNHIQSCGCFGAKKQKDNYQWKDYSPGDPIGKYGISYLHEASSPKRRRIKVLCPCGNEFISSHGSISNSSTKSCGCIHYGKYGHNHGLTASTYHRRWNGIKQRCYNPNHDAYKNYGGRGIILHEPWINDFKSFYDYIRLLPCFEEVEAEGLTIDRYPDRYGNYEPGNLRWATDLEQNNNKRNNKKK